MCEDSDGHLWIGTQQNGLFRLVQGRLQHFFTRQQGLLDDNVTSLAADSHGKVWIGGKSGLSLWTGQQFKSFTRRDGPPDDFVSGVNVARSGTVWITARNGMCQIVDGHIKLYAFQTESQGRSPEYLGTHEDRRGNLWAFGDTYLINLTEGKTLQLFPQLRGRLPCASELGVKAATAGSGSAPAAGACSALKTTVFSR